jgi:hypothetical protein
MNIFDKAPLTHEAGTEDAVPLLGLPQLYAVLMLRSGACWAWLIGAEGSGEGGVHGALFACQTLAL